jgi:hypothetical protein
MPYTADKPDGTLTTPTVEELRARIPGWGADLERSARPAFPREQPDIVTGAHWRLPEQQPEHQPRERSVEHERLTPVFGTAQPLHGLSGALRRYAYARYSEAQIAHWLLLVVGDRVEAVGAHVRSLASRRPDEPLTQSGVLGERGRRPISSRWGRGRVDLKHVWLDPLIVVGPWVLAVVVTVRLGRALFGGRRRSRSDG